MNANFDSTLIKDLKHSLLKIGEYNYQLYFPTYNSGVIIGKGGVSLFYYFLYLYTLQKEFLAKSISFFKEEFNTIDSNDLRLSSGVTGIMWLLNYYTNSKVIKMNFDVDEYLSNFDKILYKKLHVFYSDLDQMHGLLGTANYFFSRDNKISEKALNDIFHVINNKKKIAKNGITWIDNKSSQYEKKIIVNFGYAHGILGICYFLSRLLNKGIKQNECQEMLEKGLTFFSSFQNENDRTFFPNTIEFPNGESVKYSRVSYCYGDLGIASGLLAIGKILNNEKILILSKKIALNIAKVSIDNIDNIIDIGLCHGAAGNGYQFLKLYNEFKSEILFKAACLQYNKLVSLRLDGTGIGGYTSIEWDDKNKVYFRENNPSILNGSAGVGLSIISFLRRGDLSDWDKLLYLQ